MNAIVDSKLQTISFAQSSEGYVDLWPETASTGSYAGDRALGKERATEIIQYMSRNQAPEVLGHVVDAMLRRGQFGPIEAGFLNLVAVTAIA